MQSNGVGIDGPFGSVVERFTLPDREYLWELNLDLSLISVNLYQIPERFQALMSLCT